MMFTLFPVSEWRACLEVRLAGMAGRSGDDKNLKFTHDGRARTSAERFGRHKFPEIFSGIAWYIAAI
jgi:hypothetical protein